MKKQDSKYFYTAQLMNQALIALLEKKDIDFITVTEITKKAGVNRSTFYLHYDDIYELLEETIENISKQFIASFDMSDSFKMESKKDAFLITDNMLIPYLNFVKTNKRILKLIHSKPKLFNAKSTYKQFYDTVFYPAVSFFVSDEKEKTYYLEFFTGGVTSVINKWIEQDCITEIDDLVVIIKKCINYNV